MSLDSFTELRNLRQLPDEPPRRWFRSNDFDLIVWLDPADRPQGFQLCYDRRRLERALTWTPELGYLHTAVDDGESVGLRYKETPILVADGELDAERLGFRFLAAGHGLPADITDFVVTKIREYAERNG